jgi:hypothetical protein
MGVAEDLVHDHVPGSDPGDPVHAGGRRGEVARNPSPKEHRSSDSVKELEREEKGQTEVKKSETEEGDATRPVSRDFAGSGDS